MLTILVTLPDSKLNANPCGTDPCLDANNVPWVNDDITFTPNSNFPQCWVRVIFRYRDNNGTNPVCPNSDPIELEILTVIVSGGCYIPPSNEYSSWGDVHRVFFDIYEELMKNHLPGMVPVVYGECGPKIRSSKSVSCTRHQQNYDGTITYIWCQAETCCIVEMWLCKPPFGAPSTALETHIGYNGTTPPNLLNCAPDTEPGCVFRCMGDGAVPPKVNNEFENFKGIRLEILNNHNDLRLISDDKYSGRLDIEIVNMNGERVLIENNNLLNTSLDMYLSINSFINGTYLINVKLNGEVLFKNKFIIVK